MLQNHCKLAAIGLILLLVLPAGRAAAAEQEIIYREAAVTPLAPGVSYEVVWQFTPAGWMRVHLLRADLTNPAVQTDLLLPQKGLSATERTSQMAASSGAIGALNGDFFFGGGVGTPLGPVITAGQLLSSPSLRSDLAVFAVGGNQPILLDSWPFFGQIKTHEGYGCDLAGWNKPGDSYRRLYGYDEHWGSFTPSTVPEGSLAAVIRSGMVVELQAAKGGVAIPPNGQVIVGAEEGAEFLLRHLPTGSRVEIDLTTVPSWEDYDWAVGGGSILVRDGLVVPFTHEIKGNSPRSAIGLSADGRQLILAAVEGRLEESRGLTQMEWASLLVDLGAHQALNLDGGGSTALMARLPGQEQAMPVSQPSDQVERPVGNAIGIFSSAPASELAGLNLWAADTRVAPGCGREISVAAFDTNYNFVALTESAIGWQVEPAGLGSVSDNVFVAGQQAGKGRIIATSGAARGELEIEVIGVPIRLDLSPERLSLSPEKEAVISAHAVDADGRKAQLRSQDVVWRVLGDVGTVEGGRFTAGASLAAGAVEAELGPVTARTLVAVGTEEIPLLYFEALLGISAEAFPGTVRGAVSLAGLPDPVYDRQHSLRLDYDFTAGCEATKAAYVVFDDGLALPGQADRLSLMVHGDGQGHWLRALLADKNGQEFTVDFAREVDWTGWRKTEAQLPGGAYPYVLKRIYAVQPDGSRHNAGSLYFDNLALVTTAAFDADLELGRKPFPDPQYHTSSSPQDPGFLVVAGLPAVRDDLSWTASVQQAIAASGARYIVCLKPLDETHRLAWEQLLGVPVRCPDRTERWDEAQSSCLHLNTTGGSLVHGDASDWRALEAELSLTPEAGQLFIFSEHQPFAMSGGFSSPPEAQLMRRRLAEAQQRLGALVWVFSSAKESGFFFEDGVRYQNMKLAVGDEAPRLALIRFVNGRATYQGLKY